MAPVCTWLLLQRSYEEVPASTHHRCCSPLFALLPLHRGLLYGQVPGYERACLIFVAGAILEMFGEVPPGHYADVPVWHLPPHLE